MHSIRLTVGIELRGDGLPLTPMERKDGLLTIEQAALSEFGGFTSVPGTGVWRAPDGAVHAENSVTFDIATDDPEAVEKAQRLAVVARDAMKQQAVLLRHHEDTGQFV